MSRLVKRYRPRLQNESPWFDSKSGCHSSKQAQKAEQKDTRGAGVPLDIISPRPLNNLPANAGAVPPSVSKANEVGGSVVPTNGRPYFSGDMGNTPARAVTVTVPGKRENPGSTPGLAFLKGGR